MLPRLVAAIGLCAILPPSAATAQQQDALLSGCSSWKVSHRGEREYNPETKSGRIAVEVQIACDSVSIFADEVRWDDRMLYASGSVAVIQPGLRLTASRMEMDRGTRLGTFHDAFGTARLTDGMADRSMFGSMEPEVMFYGEKIEKTGPRTYRLTGGAFTTCVQPTPRWQMTGSAVTVTLDERVVLNNGLLRVKGVPVLWVPWMSVPLRKEDRASGFLMPAYTSSTVRGHGASNAYFWAINRSQDATLYHDWFSRSGQGGGLDYRYVAAPGSQGDVRMYVLDERDRFAPDGTIERAASRSTTIQGTINQAFGRTWRLIGRANYFSDVTSQQLYQQNLYDLSRRERSVGATLSGRFADSYRLSARVEQRDFYTGFASAQRTGRTPQVSVWREIRPIGRSPVSWGATGDAAYLVTRPDLDSPASDRSLWRFDGAPSISGPLSRLSWLSARGDASWRITHWLERLDPATGLPVARSITRNLIDLRAEMTGPEFSRVWQTPENGYAERFKHLVQPRLSVQWLSPFDRLNEVILTDHVDRIVGGTTTVSYSLANIVMARVRRPEGESVVRSIVTVAVSQSYYTNALAGAFDAQYQQASAGTFSPVQVSATVTPTDGVSGRFQMFLDARTKSPTSYSGSASVYRERGQVTAGWSMRRFLPNVPGFDREESASHFVNGNAVLRFLNNRLGATYGADLDLRRRTLLQQRVMGFYNAQCCGISVDYQTINLSHFGLAAVPNDRRFAISITLAGIGSFAPPLGAFRQ